MKILITAFDRFGHSEVNSSELVLNELPDEIEGKHITKLLLPTIRHESIKKIEAMNWQDFDVILLLGMASNRSRLSIERVAINVDDFRIPDNGGNQPIDEPIVKDGPAAYFSTLPIRKILSHLHGMQIPAELSNTAGTFVCNHIMYQVAHLIVVNHLETKSGFVHIPAFDSDKKDSYVRAVIELVKAL